MGILFTARLPPWTKDVRVKFGEIRTPIFRFCPSPFWEKILLGEGWGRTYIWPSSPNFWPPSLKIDFCNFYSLVSLPTFSYFPRVFLFSWPPHFFAFFKYRGTPSRSPPCKSMFFSDKTASSWTKSATDGRPKCRNVPKLKKVKFKRP